jgi:hypothetical protein
MLSRIAIPLLLALALSGCAQDLVLRIDAIAASEGLQGRAYVWRSKLSQVSEDDLYFREFSAHMQAALRQQGFRQVKSPESADLVIYFSYGVTPGATRYYTTTTPVYDWVGGEIVTYTMTETDAAGKTTRKSGQTTLPMREQIIGFDRERYSYTPYSSYATLEAREAKTDRPLWNASVTAIGDGVEDLRQTMPLLADTLAPWLAKDSHGIKVVKVPHDAPRGMPSQGLAKPR